MAVIILATLLAVALKPTDTAPLVKNLPAPARDILKTLRKANSGLDSVLFQGDIKKRPPQKLKPVMGGVASNADPCTSSTCKWPKGTRDVTIPLLFDPSFTPTQKKTILDALQIFKAETCVRFVPYKSTNQDYLHITSGSGCWSHIGFQRGAQNLSLQADGCLYTSIIQHEMLHALGFEHEHSRSDRDENILIQWSNIAPGAESNFEKVATNNLQTPYDFGSILQYGPKAFSMNDAITIKPLDPTISEFGDASNMSPIDILRVNRLYQC